MSRRSSNLFRRTIGDSLQGRVSLIIDFNLVKSVSAKYHNYTEPRIVKGTRWYIIFYYKVPLELRDKFGCEWYRFRVNHRINKYRDDEYAQEILDALRYSLEKGFNPFKDEENEFNLKVGVKSDISISEAIDFFIDKHNEKGLEPNTIARYKMVCNLILDWAHKKGLLSRSIKDIKKINIEQILSENKEVKKWSNRQYNNVKGYISIIFSYLYKNDIIEKNPVASIERLKSSSKKHKAYDNKLFDKLSTVIKTNDPYLWNAVMFVYYLFVRSSKELRLLKVGDILEGGLQYRFRAEATKSNRDDIIPIHSNLKNVMVDMGLFNANPDYYIFGIKHRPGAKPVNTDYFSSRFARIRKLAGLQSDHTLFGMRHTRATHLIQDGAKLADISRMMRHKDVSITAKYIRDLGQDFDSKELQRLTRDI